MNSCLESTAEPKEKEPLRLEIMWLSVVVLVLLHAGALGGLYCAFTSAKWRTIIFAFILYTLSILGITAGAHRLWCHRTYKAKLPLRIFLAYINTMAYQNDIYIWSRDHRVHHKYSDTDADPHNVTRGFFFSHVGWIMYRKHPEVIAKGKTIDLSDVLNDPVVKFQRKYYFRLVALCCFALPTAIPMLFWEESFTNAFLVAGFLKHVVGLHLILLVNSAAHMWGYRPYDKTIQPRQNLMVSLGSAGEAFHNYHHVFPYDYAASEYGIKYNLTTMFIDLMAYLGQAFDRKVAPRHVIQLRKEKSGEKNGTAEGSAQE